MSTMEMELNSMNNTSEENPVIAGEENVQKSITGLDELLEQELKENDSVDCFIKRVGDAGEDSSEFGLNYDETQVVSSSAFYSPKEVTSTDNISSSLDKELEDTLNKNKEVPLTSDGEKLQDVEEETRKDDISVITTSVEDIDESTKKIQDEWEDDMISTNDEESVENQNENSIVSEETGSEVRDEVHKDDMEVDKEDIVVKDATIEKGTGEEVHNSAEIKLPSEILNNDTEQNEKDTNSESEKAENTTDIQKDVFFLVLQPQDEINELNNGGKHNESKQTVQCSDTSTTSDDVIISNTNPVNPAPKTVLTIAGSSEGKNVRAINKSVIVKKITAKIIKNGSAATTKPANECKIDDHTSGEGSLNSVMSSELEEKPDNMFDNSGEEPEKALHNNDTGNVEITTPVAILTRKVYGNTKKNPKVLQEKQVLTNTEDEGASNIDTRDHHNNADHDKKSVLDDGNRLLLETKVHDSSEGKTLPDKSKVSGKEGVEITKRTTNFGAVKRKFEEVCRISREEEDAAIEEIKKMKKEMVDVLKKINTEMEKLRFVFLAGKQK